MVARDSSAETRVRRGSQFLLRRPWERLSVLATPAGDVALAFAGERGGVARDEESGCLVAFDGEFFGPPRSGEEAARELLGLYLDPVGEPDPPDGCYAGALWDPRTGTLRLLTDRFARRPLHVATTGGTTFAATEIKALVPILPPTSLDHQFWAEALAYEYVVSDRSPLAGVRPLPFATTLIDTGAKTTEHVRWHYRLSPGPSQGGDRDLVEEFARLLEASVLSRLDDERCALALSGGLDSRCLAGLLAAREYHGVAASFGEAGSEDLELATEVAHRLGLPHRRFVHERGYIARKAEEVVWLAEGRVRCFHVNQLALRPLRTEEQLSSILVGFLGDDVVRTALHVHAGRSEDEFVDFVHRGLAHYVHDHLVDELLEPGFAEQLRGRARAGLAGSLAREEGSPQARYKQMMARYAQSPSSLFDDHLFPRDPFTDPELVEFCRRLPERLRWRGRLERDYLRRFSGVAELPSPKQGVTPSASGWREGVQVQMKRVRTRVRKAATQVMGAGWRPQPGDYAADLRAGGAGLLSILVEPRTLDRGQLRADTVRRRVTDTLAGRGVHTYQLGMLLTLELFQRQFVDGDGFGSSRESAELEEARAF